MDWYYMDGDRKMGPINDEAFHSLLMASVITAETPVWRQGWGEWRKGNDPSIVQPPPFTRSNSRSSKVAPPVSSSATPATKIQKTSIRSTVTAFCMIFFGAFLFVLVPLVGWVIGPILVIWGFVMLCSAD